MDNTAYYKLLLLYVVAEDGDLESSEPLSSSKEKLRTITQHLMDEACTRIDRDIRSAITNRVHVE